MVHRDEIRPWQDAATLEWAYEKHDRDCYSVADLLGCDRRTVNRWLDRHGLYPDKPGWQSEDTLRRLYIDEDISQHALADRFDRTQDTIAYWLEKFGIADHECPTCNDTFPSKHGVKIHHTNIHGESIAGREIECEYCGDEFTRPPSHSTGRRYCSPECRASWMSENYTGDNHWNWKGGRRPDYGPGWDEEKREAVRNRDDRQCVDCGITDDDHVNLFGSRLHVHHLTPAAEIDDPQERNALDNLVTLCCRCHLSREQA